MIAAGRLRYHRITIQNPVRTKDDDGNDILEFVNAFEAVPAEDKPLSVRDVIAAKAHDAQMKGRFVIRKRPGLRDDQRIISKGKAYDIAGWFPDPESGEDYVTAPYTEGTRKVGP